MYEINTSNGKMILKGFPSLRALKIQENFTRSLKKEGFRQTYEFISCFKEPLYFENRYYGCLEYIEPGAQPFYYDSKEQCSEGLELLESFHQTTAKLVGNFQTDLPLFTLKDKWRERFQLFQSYEELLSFFLPLNILRPLYFWGHWSLNGLRQNWASFTQYQKVVIHGDTAFHNFFRTAKNELFLIDFDLISIGPAVNDYLQYANRILPLFNWNIDVLMSHKQFYPYLRERSFLYALAYPTDIFREWNRLIRERKYHETRNVRQVMELTMKQFEQRILFYYQIGNALK